MWKKTSMYWKFQLIAWVSISTFSYLFGSFVNIDYKNNIYQPKPLLRVATLFAVIGFLVAILMGRLLVKMNVLQKPFKIQVVYLFGATILFSVLYTILFNTLVNGMGSAFDIGQDAEGTFFIRTGIAFGSLLIGNLVYFIYHYLDKSRRQQVEKILLENELEVQKLESEKKLLDLEMQALRAQMNPHFIFNCLNSINRFIVMNESEPASDYLTKFSRLIRMVMQNSTNRIISLADELETLRLYLELEQVRFKDHFSYTIYCDDAIDTNSLVLPPMTLQPFVENAIWHGLMHTGKDGKLTIEIKMENEMLCCIIEDNGIGREKSIQLKDTKPTYKKSLGMQIIAQRLQLLNNNNCNHPILNVVDLKNEESVGIGTKVIIRIPLNVEETLTS